MEQKKRIMTFLVTLFALRKRQDYIIKPGIWIVMVYIIATVSELAVRPDDMMAPTARLVIVTITSLPFCALVFCTINYLDMLQNKLAELATTDMLTGLPNRRAFLERSSRLNARGRVGVIAIIDADHFKRINDTFGHAVGDQCLRAIARQLRETTRQGDIIGRLGGEEFAVYFTGIRTQDAFAIAEKLTAEIQIENEETGDDVRFTLSVGAVKTDASESIEGFLKKADEALYQAKRNGRARLVLWQGDHTTPLPKAG